MRIVFVDPEPKSDHGGGIRTYINLCINLCEKNNISTMLYSHNINEYPKFINKKEIQRLTLENRFFKKMLYKLAYPALITAEFSNWLAKELVNNSQPEDIIEFCDFGGYGFYSFKKMENFRKLILRVHTPSFVIPNKRQNIISGWILSFMEKYCLKKAKNLTAPSLNFVKEILPAFSYAKYIRNPLPVYKAKRNKIKSFESLCILFIGRIEKRKGLDVLLAALSQIKTIDIKLTVVGGGMESEYGKLIRDFVKNRLPSNINIQFLNEISKKQIDSLDEENHFCILPSLFENSPYAFFEQLAQNLVVLGSATGEMPVVLKELGFPIFKPQNPENLRQTLMEIFGRCKSNPKFYGELLERQHGWYVKAKPEIDKEWLGFYQGLANG